MIPINTTKIVYTAMASRLFALIHSQIYHQLA